MMLLNRFGKFNKFNNYGKSTNVIDNFKTAQNIQLYNFSTMANSDRDISNRSGKKLNMPNYILNQKKYLFTENAGDVMYFAALGGMFYIGWLSAQPHIIIITEKQKEEVDKSAVVKKQSEESNVINITLDETDMTTLAGAKLGYCEKNINGVKVIISVASSNTNSENKTQL